MCACERHAPPSAPPTLPTLTQLHPCPPCPLPPPTSRSSSSVTSGCSRDTTPGRNSANARINCSRSSPPSSSSSLSASSWAERSTRTPAWGGGTRLRAAGTGGGGVWASGGRRRGARAQRAPTRLPASPPLTAAAPAALQGRCAPSLLATRPRGEWMARSAAGPLLLLAPQLLAVGWAWSMVRRRGARCRPPALGPRQPSPPPARWGVEGGEARARYNEESVQERVERK